MNKISEIFDNNSKIKCLAVSTLSSEQITFLKEKCPVILDKIKSYTVFIWKDRIEHIKKHSYDVSGFSTNEMIDLLPSIIETPDYIGYRTKDNSLQFIKLINGNLLAAVRTDSNK